MLTIDDERVLIAGWIRPRYDHRHTDRLDDSVTHRAQQHSGHGASSVTADDDKFCGRRHFGERASRSTAEQKSLHCHIRIAFLPAGQAFSQNPFFFSLHCRPVEAGRSKISTSLHACSAISSTPRCEASSNAIAVARFEAVEPSIPNGTGVRSGCCVVGSPPRMTATGQCARRTRPEVTGPSMPPEDFLRPCDLRPYGNHRIHYVNQTEGQVAHDGVTCCAPESGAGCGVSVDADDDTMVFGPI